MMGLNSCPRCGGSVLNLYGEAVCINCGWDGPKVIADHRHPVNQGQAPTYEGTVRHIEWLRARSGKASQRAGARRGAVG